MRIEALQSARVVVLSIAVCLMVAVFVYWGLVELTKNVYIYFKGYVPGADVGVVRAVFYTLAGLGVFATVFFKKRFFSKERFVAHKNNDDELQHYLIGRSIYVFLIAEIPATSGFFMYFISLLHWDFYLLAVISLVLIYLNIPTVRYWEERLS